MIGFDFFKYSIHSYIAFWHYECCFCCICICKFYINKHIVDCYFPTYKLLVGSGCISCDLNCFARFCFVFVFSCCFFICSTAYYCYMVGFDFFKHSIYSYVTVRHCKCSFCCSLVSKFYRNKHIVDCNFPAYKFLVRTRCISSDLNCFARLCFVFVFSCCFFICSTTYYCYMVGFDFFKHSIYSYVTVRHCKCSFCCSLVSKFYRNKHIVDCNFPAYKFLVRTRCISSDLNCFARLCFVFVFSCCFFICSTTYYCYMVGFDFFKYSIYSYTARRHYECCFCCTCICKLYITIYDCPAYKLLTIQCIGRNGNCFAFNSA